MDGLEIPPILRRGDPACFVKVSRSPAPPRPRSNNGLSLAIPASIAKAIAADFAAPDDENIQQAAIPVATTTEEDTMTTKSTAKKTTTAKKPSKKAAVKPATTKKPNANARAAVKPGDRARYDWNAADEKAKAGTVPTPPDFSAPTHTRFRDLLSDVVAAARAGDLARLKEIKITAASSSPKAVDRYRGLCVIALGAKAKA